MTVRSIEGNFVTGDERRVPVEEIAGISVLRTSTLDTGEVSRVIWAYALVGYLLALAF